MNLKPIPLFPLPPPSLIGRVSGSSDVEQFATSGHRTFMEWANALQTVGKSFGDFQRIVDFGCGCGRVLRHLKPNLDAKQVLIGVDVDGEAIDWINKNYLDINGVHLGLLPPSGIETNSIDLVVNQSVFTHLPEDVQFAWLAELHRILKPGGIAILSFHGRKVWGGFCDSLIRGGRANEVAILSERFERRGFYYIQGRSELEGDLPEYYGSSFHTIAYIEQEWGRYFRLKAWLPVASLGHQDIIVLENK